MDAMNYEIIIRFANGDCGRYGTAGANADIYRHLSMSYAYYNEAKSAAEAGKHNNLPNTTLQYGIALGEVSAFIADAAERIKRTYSEHLTEAQREILSSAYLTSPTMESVDKAIEDVSNLIPELREIQLDSN